MVPIGEGSYSRGSDMRVFISNPKEQLWQGHLGGGGGVLIREVLLSDVLLSVFDCMSMIPYVV